MGGVPVSVGFILVAGSVNFFISRRGRRIAGQVKANQSFLQIQHDVVKYGLADFGRQQSFHFCGGAEKITAENAVQDRPLAFFLIKILDIMNADPGFGEDQMTSGRGGYGEPVNLKAGNLNHVPYPAHRQGEIGFFQGGPFFIDQSQQMGLLNGHKTDRGPGIQEPVAPGLFIAIREKNMVDHRITSESGKGRNIVGVGELEKLDKPQRDSKAIFGRRESPGSLTSAAK